jgi:adenine-specific DNA-methyltransferase
MPRGKLELTWVGKDERPRLEPRVLVEDPSKSYGDPNSENMLIFGDNLLALKALEQDFAGLIKCIYIDPPYNTGSAWEHYDDGLEHSLWLSMMRDRLELLTRLLCDDGILVVQIDDNEQGYLRVLLDGILGRNNFVATIVWQKKYGSKSDSKFFSESHEYLLVYGRDIEKAQINRLARTAEQDARYKNPDGDPRGLWTSGDLLRNEARDYAIYPIVGPSGRAHWPPKGTSWRFTKERVEELRADRRVWFGHKGDNVPRLKRFLSEVAESVPATTLWLHTDAGHTDEGKKEMRVLFPDHEVYFATPKPERLLGRVLEVASQPGDWVLDSFAGSGTTGAVAHKMDRKWIMVELGEHCHTHIIPRMQKVIDGTDQGGISEAVGWKGGGGFKYYRLAETLLVQDKDLSAKGHPVYIINPKYDDKMLIRAICKVEGFRYRNEGRLHGVSSENRFLHVTTQLLTQAYLDSLVSDIRLEQSLLIYCTRRSRHIVVPDNVEVKKIPRDLLDKCDYAEDVK